MRKNILLLLVLLAALNIFAQDKTIQGTIYGLDEDNKKAPLAFANIIWLGSQTGAVSEENGSFIITNPANKHNQLVISFVGYKTDTIAVINYDKELEIVLATTLQLEEVNIEGSRAARSISSLTTINTESISSDGLQRLACCSLAESFETTATIDVGYADAVS
ncbi:MAG: TonB-dependent receptor, partial [Bacteroidetes bacterium]